MLFGASQDYFGAHESEPRPLARASYALRVITGPGALIGGLTVSTLDAYGLADLNWRHETPANGRRIGWRLAQKIEDWVANGSNMALFGALWLLWRSGGRRRVTARIVTLVWLVPMVPLAVFGSLWTVY
jgi:hypothetical protein